MNFKNIVAWLSATATIATTPVSAFDIQEIPNWWAQITLTKAEVIDTLATLGAMTACEGEDIWFEGDSWLDKKSEKKIEDFMNKFMKENGVDVSLKLFKIMKQNDCKLPTNFLLNK